MKQLAQNLRTGETLLLEVPVPLPQKGRLLIKTRKTLISAGTERMLVAFSRANFLHKARQHPDKLRLVLDRIKTEGFWQAARLVLRRLDQVLPLGYCNLGEIVAIGAGVEGFTIGDRVVSNGPHAELVSVPVNLVAKVPADLPDEEAVFTVLGAVGLHGVRLLGPALGERVAVIGLGLVGLMVVDLLLAQGCQVMGLEPDQSRRDIAVQKGIAAVDSSNASARSIVEQFGEMDGVLITASSRSADIISLAAAICRKRGKIVLIGDVPLHLNRADFYEKEITFQISCSYGPGRHDAHYEEEGADYPLPYVRWTENRNFQEVLRLLRSGLLRVRPLISQVISLADYARVQGHASLGVLIDYTGACSPEQTLTQTPAAWKRQAVVAAVIGAGNYAAMTLLPCLRGKCIKYISSAGGLHAAELAAKFEVPFVLTDYQTALSDDEVNLIIIATRHDQHVTMVVDAIRAGKHVFVEKPLAIDAEGLLRVQAAMQPANGSLTVGFNRRYAPPIVKMRALLDGAPMNVVITVNAGHLPASAWQHDGARGGGRLVGEACHFIDLVACLAQSRITAVCAQALAVRDCMRTDNVSVLIRLANGSTGAVHYFSNGHSSYPKERVEVHSLGRTLVLDHFKHLRGYGFGAFSAKSYSAGKGHREQFDALFECIAKSGKGCMPLEDIWNAMAATLAARESLWSGNWEKVL